MRRKFCECIPKFSCARFFVVGTRNVLPSVESIPTFESRRKRRIRLSEGEINKNENTLSNISKFVKIDEDEAKSICFEKYGFLQKPLFMHSWSEFLNELKRFEFRWSLIPSTSGVIVFTVIEHGIEGEKILCNLKGGSGCAPIAEFFECCGGLIQGSSNKFNVRFRSLEGLEYVVNVISKKRLTQNDSISPPYDEPILPILAQYNCRGTSVDVFITETKTGVQNLLFSNMSLQAFNYAFLTSIPLFLKRTDVGVRNVDFVSKDQMRHFRFAWCFLRRESLMTAVEMSELDTLLPP